MKTVLGREFECNVEYILRYYSNDCKSSAS
jgi:hypothetical protein